MKCYLRTAFSVYMRHRVYIIITYNTWYVCLQVLGCTKGVLATSISVFLFGNQISPLGALGYAITVIGVFAYGWSKHQRM